jgi:hypothetical protein
MSSGYKRLPEDQAQPSLFVRARRVSDSLTEALELPPPTVSTADANERASPKSAVQALVLRLKQRQDKGARNTAVK